MLALSHDHSGAQIASFRNYRELYHYIVQQESIKDSKCNSSPEGQWRFHFLAPEYIREQVDAMKLETEQNFLLEARRRGKSLIALHQGDSPVTWVLVKKMEEIYRLQEEWVRAYCKAHGMNIADIEASQTPNHNISAWM